MISIDFYRYSFNFLLIDNIYIYIPQTARYEWRGSDGSVPTTGADRPAPAIGLLGASSLSFFWESRKRLSLESRRHFGLPKEGPETLEFVIFLVQLNI